MLIGNKTKTAKDDKDLWATPWEIFHGVEALFNRKFNLDACASQHNAKCQQFITAKQNMLTCNWGNEWKNVWINPPYSDPMPYIQRALEQSKKHHHFIVMLLPADTSVAWFDLCVKQASQIWFITANGKQGGRISFLHNQNGKKQSGNAKGSMLVVFEPIYRLGKMSADTYYISREELQNLGEQEKNND